ncbi:hypothetical protein GCM10010168_19320 [Actinoplanes ianthinogenes]|uniref:HTH araC/xylS-type domain-containing protein n=1 Tax=Actinoplanes ianthinogenes TaxID=122358 RepID=A0ABN6CVB4_9ACTN|nr:AraC family transcriptional regulator [Actinoplanes ianthinogenes]BCJ47574.1 hypothetical protein Aiant_82310 [Actinoplanes ianthinogenes]GGR02703.1 hypothetical protein GCM10010168_19320 [Actinoplanes ianthinogenes]
MTPTPALVPVERAVLRSIDPGEVHEIQRRRYVEYRSRVVNGADRFVFRSQSASAGLLTVDQITYAATMANVAEPFTTMLIVSVLDGRFDVTAGRRHARVVRGDSLLYPAHVRLRLLMDRMTFQVARFPIAAVSRGAERAGVPAPDLRFEAMTAVSPAAGRQWLATVAYLTRLLSGPQITVPALLLAAAMDTAAAAALSVFPNTTMTLDYTPGPGQAPPAVVRRAIAYIDAHAARPITVEDIATAAGIGVRGLQAAFARHRDTTPTGYLRQVRLEHAHHDLQAADPTRGDTVTTIARKWGFTTPSRFATTYHTAYGSRPATRYALEQGCPWCTRTCMRPATPRPPNRCSRTSTPACG